jgi:hypothetical protein
MKTNELYRKGIQENPRKHAQYFREESGIIIASTVNGPTTGDYNRVIGTDQCWKEFRTLERLRLQTTDDYAVWAVGSRPKVSTVLRGSHDF